MDHINKEYFELSELLLLDDLGVRHFAEVKQSLSVKEYFSKLHEFLNLAPNVSRAIGKFENREGNIPDRRSVNDMINLLDSIGCEKFVIDFHSILDAYENEGNWRLASTYARRVRDDFNDFCSRINDARCEKGVDGAMLLKEAIRILDEEKSGSKLLILAIDDSPVILRSVSVILGGEYKVITLTNPMEIEKVLHKHNPDLFLLDYQMPELDGFELIPLIRQFEEHKDTPIVFLTSAGTIDTLTTAIAMGAKDFIVKPFNPETLKEKISKCISS